MILTKTVAFYRYNYILAFLISTKFNKKNKHLFIFFNFYLVALLSYTNRKRIKKSVNPPTI